MLDDSHLVRLLQLQHQNGRAVDAVKEVFATDGFLHVDILSVVLDAVDAPPETVEESYRDRLAAMVIEGTEAECRAFLAWVRSR